MSRREVLTSHGLFRHTLIRWTSNIDDFRTLCDKAENKVTDYATVLVCGHVATYN